MDKIFVRSGFPFNYDADMVSEETGLRCEDETLAKQSFAEECDINTIVRRFHLTGEVPHDVRMPTFGDFEEVYDYHSAAQAIADARESFMAMPAEVRARFGNDAGAFVEFCSKDENRDEAKRLGLLVPEPVVDEPVPMKVEVVNPAPPVVPKPL